jgi:hypothetical protein
MFLRWFRKREKPADPSDGVVVLRERGQQIRIGKDIIVSILSVTPGGAMVTIQAPPHLQLGFPPVGDAKDD